jgi:sugar O-acyltransferase (sialic acid O-acetyltransferase NeuD family)
MKKQLCIFGSGGFAREVASYILSGETKESFDIACFIDPNEQDDVMGIPVFPPSYFDEKVHLACVAVGSPKTRKKIVAELPFFTIYPRIVHKQTYVGTKVVFGKGTITCPFSCITTNVRVGDFCVFNNNNSIGHDCEIGDFVTSSPGVNLSGNCNVGSGVYLGSNCCIKEKITISENVVIGANAFVSKDINTEGTYVGIPARLIGS